MKKLLSVVLAICCFLTMAMPTFAADEVTEYDPSWIVIPFEKTWDDDNNSDGSRPDSITVKLYKYRQDQDWTEGTVYTQVVTAADGWKYDFVFENVPNDGDTTDDAFYKVGNEYFAYQFKITEDPIPNYDLESSYDPEVILSVIDGENGWDRTEPCNKLTHAIKTDAYPMSFVVVKPTKNRNFVIWTPDELSAYEREMFYYFVKAQPGFNKLKFDKITWLTGFGAYVNGMTVTDSLLSFGGTPDWTYYAVGSYTRSVLSQHQCGIENQHIPGQVTVSVTKIWDDGDDADSIRPTELTVTLLREVGGETVPYTDESGNPMTVTLNAENGWHDSWEELPEKIDGDDVVYSVEESVLPEGYEPGTPVKSEDGYAFTITNSHTPETIDVKVTKVWDDLANPWEPNHVAVTVHLLADGAETDEDPIVLSEDNGWTETWTDLDPHKTYSVSEDPVEGYEVSYSSNEAGTDFTVTNSFIPIPTIDIEVVKVWDDQDNQDGIQPEEITVNLYIGEGDDKAAADEEPIVLNADNNWTGYFESLLQHDQNGEEIVYSVEEDAVEGYEAAVEKSEDEFGVIFTITNTHTPEESSVPESSESSVPESSESSVPESSESSVPESSESSVPDSSVPESSDPTPLPTPKTGDMSSQGLWFSIVLMGVCALCGAMVYIRKIRSK